MIENNMSYVSSLSEDDEDTTLDWRMEPSKSLSDFTLEIVNEETGQAAAYHVHRVVLAVGHRKCGYLRDVITGRKVERVTSSDRTNGSRGSRDSRNSRSSRKSTISRCTMRMNKRACQMIPQFLAYVYNSSDFALTTKTAVGMSFLAQLFVQTSLQAEVKDFIRNDLSFANLPRYYEDSIYFDQQETSTLVARVCAKEILHIDISSPILWNFSPQFFLVVVSSAAPHVSTMNDPAASQAHLSQLVASFCIINRENLDGVMFEMLTSKDRLPIIDLKAGIQLLEIEADIRMKSKHKIANSANLNGVPMTCLQSRCVKMIIEDWQNLSQLAGSYLRGVLSKLPSAVTAHLFQEVVLRSATALFEMEKTLGGMQGREVQFAQDRDVAYQKVDDAMVRERKLLESIEAGKKRERRLHEKVQQFEARERTLVETLEATEERERVLKDHAEAGRNRERRLQKTVEATAHTLQLEISEQRMLNERLQDAYHSDKQAWEVEGREWQEERWTMESERQEWEKVRSKWEQDFIMVKQEIRRLQQQQSDDDVELNPLSVSSVATSYASKYFEGSVFSRKPGLDRIERRERLPADSVILEYSQSTTKNFENN